MKFQPSTIFWTFIWCLFMGVIVISIGFGALFPSMNRIAKPFVCPAGNMEVEEQAYNPYPGKAVTTITWYCVDSASGTKTVLDIFPMSLYAGSIYGFLLFVVVFIGMWISASRRPKMENRPGHISEAHVRAVLEQSEGFRNAARKYPEDFADSLNKVQASENVLSRMKELKELHAANLISEAEYQEKRAAILKDL